MGCDIHLHQEIKVGGRWYHYAHRSVDRSYKLFGLMAGVRQPENQLFPVRGIPVDMSVVTRLDYDYWKMDAHTCSWISAKEITILAENFCQPDNHMKKYGLTRDIMAESDWFGWLFGNSWGGFSEGEDFYPEQVQDIRWVFWFDN